MMKILTVIFISWAFSAQASFSWQMKIIHEARNIYYPLSLKELGLPLTIAVKDSPIVSGSADYGFDAAKVEIYKGLLNSPRLTPDALRMVICHELGHLFGGDPKRNIPPEWEGPVRPDGMSYMSAEGQADYYAGNDCFKKLLREKVTVERTSQAALDFLNLVKDFPIAIDTPDLSVSPELIRDSYPSRQCRLDTIIAGAKNAVRPACWYK